MSLSRRLCAWVASSLIAAALYSGKAAAVECPVRTMDLAGPESVAVLKAHLESVADTLWAGAALAPTPDEVARTAQETIPNIVRSMWLRPVDRSPFATADAYAGSDYASSSSDVFVLPGGERAACHMLPGVTVFLSDGTTFHYTTVADVDFASETITLADPWSKVSFLRKGFNQADVAAAEVATVGGHMGLRLTFAEFARVFRGQIDATADIAGYSPLVTFSALAQIYPEIAGTPAFELWRGSRLASQFDTMLGPILIGELMQRADLDSSAGLGTLADTVELMFAVQSGFIQRVTLRKRAVDSIPESTGQGSQPNELAALRRDMIGRLDDTLAAMPSVIGFKLLEYAARGDELELRLAIADALLASHPDDIEWMIERARALLMMARDAEAAAALERAQQRWSEVVTTVIDLPPEQALAWFESNSRALYLQTYNILHWQRARIALLSAIAEPRSVSGPVFDWLLGQGKTYAPDRTFGIAFDYLDEALWLAWRKGELEIERTLIATGIANGASDERWQTHMSRAVLEHALWRRPIRDLLGPDYWEPVRASFLKTGLCSEYAARLPPADAVAPDAETRRKDLAAFCAP